MNGVSGNATNLLYCTDRFLYVPVKKTKRIILKHISPTDSRFAVNRIVAALITALVGFVKTVKPYSKKKAAED